MYYWYCFRYILTYKEINHKAVRSDLRQITTSRTVLSRQTESRSQIARRILQEVTTIPTAEARQRVKGSVLLLRIECTIVYVRSRTITLLLQIAITNQPDTLRRS